MSDTNEDDNNIHEDFTLFVKNHEYLVMREHFLAWYRNRIWESEAYLKSIKKGKCWYKRHKNRVKRYWRLKGIDINNYEETLLKVFEKLCGAHPIIRRFRHV